MKFSTKYKILLWKRYFDIGFGVTSYIKYFIAFFGLASNDVKSTMIMAAAYGLLCFLVGWLWIRSEFIVVEQEISNKYNLFVDEVRKKLKVKNSRIRKI